jgi:hypothetical protein
MVLKRTQHFLIRVIFNIKSMSTKWITIFPSYVIDDTIALV